jgi:glycosyltransferase involved in cell wall biosynthesis
LAERSDVSEPGPTVSVVIPAHQAERFLEESIRSVLEQDRPAVEIVVVDDGSTDSTGEIAESFGDPVRVVHHPTNRGEAAARNSGLAAALGDCIGMHDADDRMLPHRLRTQVEHLVAGGDGLGCVIGQMHTFTEDGGPVPAWALPPEGEELAYGNSPVLAWRSTYDLVGGYDEALVTGTDSDWLIRVRGAGLEVGLIHEPLTERRIHDANLSGVHGDGHRGYVVALRKHLAARREAE